MKKSLLLTITASALVIGSATVADAGRGGSNSRIVNAVNTGSVDAIKAEIERAERLVCGACIPTVMALLEDDRYEIREVAAWWFAKRPAQKLELTERSLADLAGNDSIKARNAADILGAFEHPIAVPDLAAAAQRTDLSVEARAHAVRALGNIGHDSGNAGLAAAMQDGDANVRAEALDAWLKIRGQKSATPVAALVTDSDLVVRRKAAAVVGRMVESSARVALEQVLANADEDRSTRRNAAWALGRIGSAESRAVLQAAADEGDALVSMTARVALRNLR